MAQSFFQILLLIGSYALPCEIAPGLCFGNISQGLCFPAARRTPHAANRFLSPRSDVYKSIPAQLAKENHKFQYKVIKSGARVAEYGTAVDWLRAAGVVTACYRVTEGRIPLSPYSDPSAFKLYHSDSGLLTAMTGISAKSLLSETGIAFRGAIAENSVAVALTISGYNPFYWESEGRAEVDFVIQSGEYVIPVEVKSGENVRSRSLAEYVRRYSPPFSYRISEKNFGNENNIRTVPFYALFCI